MAARRADAVRVPADAPSIPVAECVSKFLKRDCLLSVFSQLSIPPGAARRAAYKMAHHGRCDGSLLAAGYSAVRRVVGRNRSAYLDRHRCGSWRTQCSAAAAAASAVGSSGGSVPVLIRVLG